MTINLHILQPKKIHQEAISLWDNDIENTILIIDDKKFENFRHLIKNKYDDFIHNVLPLNFNYKLTNISDNIKKIVICHGFFRTFNDEVTFIYYVKKLSELNKTIEIHFLTSEKTYFKPLYLIVRSLKKNGIKVVDGFKKINELLPKISLRTVEYYFYHPITEINVKIYGEIYFNNIYMLENPFGDEEMNLSFIGIDELYNCD